jgi:hypothetical protein
LGSFLVRAYDQSEHYERTGNGRRPRNDHRYKRNLVISGICGLLSIAVAGQALGADTFNGTYTGKRVLTKGSGPTCPTDDVSVTIQGSAVTFTNNGFRNFALGFDPHEDGSFSETYVDIGGWAVFVQHRWGHSGG